MADVHANLPAFEAVLADAGTVDEVVFLGDIVGFGPHPAECLDRLMALDSQAVIGNHDAAVLALPPIGSLAGPPNWDHWTRGQLSEGQLDVLSCLPTALTLTACGMAAAARHHLPEAPYLHPAMPEGVLAPFLAALPERVIVCGHSHRALDRTIGAHRLVCVPPVGQPRNGDPRAGYAVERDGILTFHLVPYEVERTVRDTLAIGLPEPFISRWISFVRTAADPEWSREYEPGTHA